jgi:hypothetical protein
VGVVGGARSGGAMLASARKTHYASSRNILL